MTSVLIVDDNPANLKVARLALSTGEFNVRTAADAEEALRLIPLHRPQLILTDIQLPGMDGLELTRRLKADPATKSIVIVALTAYAMKGDRERFLAAGCDGYLSKPIDPLQLPVVVEAHLRAHQEAPESGTDAIRSKVLVVEDNPASRRLLVSVLSNQGFTVSAAADGESALSLYRQEPPDLVVQDLCLPDLDGAELLHRLRLEGAGRRVPIFCVSGFLSTEDLEQARGRGFDEVLAKPVDPSQLVDLARLHLEESHANAAIGTTGPRVLLVEDDPLQLRLTSHYLRLAGFEVATANNGNHALEALLRSSHDGVISDVLMPEMNGFDLCLAIQTDPRLKGLPVVLTSNHYDDQDDQTLARRVGAVRLVPKAPDAAGAIAAMRGALGKAPIEGTPTPPGIARDDILRRSLAQLEQQVRRNERLSRQSLLQSAQLSVLASVADALGKKGTIEEVVADVLSNCLDMAGISRGAFLWKTPEGLVPRFVMGFTPQTIQRWKEEGGLQLLGKILQQGLITALPSPEQPAEEARAFLETCQLETALIVPVAWGGRSFGAAVFGARSLDVTGREALTFARVLGAQLGQALGLAGTFERLHASEERFRVLIESLHDSVLVVDRELRGVAAYGGQSFGGIAGDVLGVPLHVLLGQAPDNVHSQHTQSAFEGRSATYDWALERPEGTLHLQTVVSPIRSADGSIISAARVTRDITEHRRLQAQLMVADRLASMGTLAAGVAHEINNPLASVLANLELLGPSLSGHNLSPEAVAALADAKEAADRVRQIVRDLKVFSRAEEERRTAVDLGRVLDSAIRMTWNEVRHRARLLRDYGAIPLVDGNEARLGQVFVNLLVNAAQAMAEGHADTHEIRISAGNDDRWCWVDIADSGPGIRPEHLPRIFNPFFTTKPPGVGTGLGLAICQRIITELGGEILVESQLGVGSRFRVRLPRSRVEPPPEVVPPTVEPSRRGRVLIVDDDLLIVTALRRALGSAHEVQTFTSAPEALHLLEAGLDCDLILCDLMMPVMTGIDFYESLGQRRPDLQPRVVFMTGGAFSVRARQALDSLPNEHFEKPFSIPQLRALVARRLRVTTEPPPE